jgi:hypothetical protein
VEIDGIEDSINNGQVDWSALAEYANRANLAPALRQALAAKGLWESVPPTLQEYLDAMHQFNTERNEAILRHLCHVIGIINKAGITPLLMKGGAALATGLYPDPAIRFMMDLDILVPDALLICAVAALENDGYSTPEANLNETPDFNWETCKHYLPLVHDDFVAHVELHRKVFVDYQETLLSTDEIWQDSQLFTTARMKDVPCALMSPTHQILHCIIHSEISHGYYKTERLDLRQLLHFAYLCKLHADNCDWKQVAERMNNGKSGDILRGYLYRAEMLFNVVTPLASAADAESIRHFSNVMHRHVEGKGRVVWLIGEEISHVWEAFSEQGLRMRVPEHKNDSVAHLRIRYLKILVNKFSTLEKLKGYFARKVGSFVRIG